MTGLKVGDRVRINDSVRFIDFDDARTLTDRLGRNGVVETIGGHLFAVRIQGIGLLIPFNADELTLVEGDEPRLREDYVREFLDDSRRMNRIGRHSHPSPFEE